MSKRRVVVTGLGIVSPVGSSLATAWDNIKAGKSGINTISSELFDASEFSVRIAGNVKGFKVDDYIKPKDQKKMDTFIHYGIAAGVDAIRDSGLEVTEANAERIGVLMGSGIGGLQTIERNYTAFLNGGARKISPFFVPASIINMVAGNLSIMFGLKGPN
ncbi:MAG: beta-ketoacyl-ACP synthase, partial [Pseudomonadota bacterium]